MPVDFTKLLPQIRTFSDHAVKGLSQTESQLAFLRDSFAAAVSKPDLESIIRAKLAGEKTIHIALPTDEPVHQSFPRPNAAERARTVLAVDGSQVVPNRHEEIRFGLLNIGMFLTKPGSGETPREIVSTELLDEFGKAEHLDEYRVSYLRDRDERTLIAEISDDPNAPKPYVALTDGPITVFQQRKPINSGSNALPAEDRRRFELAHQTLERNRVIYAGYIDRPGSDLVVRMIQTVLDLETADAGQTKMLTDAGLFAPLLAPTERSAIFKLAAINPESEDPELLDVLFFYLNLQGAQPHRARNRAAIARVEIPSWVANDPLAVDTLHETLLAQSSIIDGVLYPYALQRAHEIALIRYDEKERIKERLIGEMTRRGLSFRDKSEKQRSKDLINPY